MTTREIAKEFGISKSCVQKTIQKVKDGLNDLDPRYVVPILKAGIKRYGSKKVLELLGEKGSENLKFYLDSYLCLLENRQESGQNQ